MNARQRHQPSVPAGRGGFTIVELLMSLLLVSILLTAVALAMRASMDTYQQNINAAAVNQAARSLAMRMQREIRQAVSVDYNAGASKVVITPPANAAGLQTITYNYDSIQEKLTYSRSYADSGKNTTETLFDSSTEIRLTGFFITYKTVQNAQGQWCTQRVICTTYFTIDGQNSPLVFTASPRRNLTY